MTDVISMHAYAYPDDEFRERAELANEALATGEKPEPGNWGICAGGDAPEAIGGQTVMFSWKADREALVEAVRNHLLYFSMPPSGYDLTAAQQRIDDALEAFQEHREGQRLAADLRNALRSHVRVDWVGSIEDLATGEDEFAQDRRRQFLDCFDQDVRTLEQGEMERFRASLEFWPFA